MWRIRRKRSCRGTNLAIFTSHLLKRKRFIFVANSPTDRQPFSLGLYTWRIS
jgi:hypothetical protein